MKNSWSTAKKKLNLHSFISIRKGTLGEKVQRTAASWHWCPCDGPCWWTQCWPSKCSQLPDIFASAKLFSSHSHTANRCCQNCFSNMNNSNEKTYMRFGFGWMAHWSSHALKCNQEASRMPKITAITQAVRWYPAVHKHLSSWNVSHWTPSHTLWYFLDKSSWIFLPMKLPRCFLHVFLIFLSKSPHHRDWILKDVQDGKHHCVKVQGSAQPPECNSARSSRRRCRCLPVELLESLDQKLLPNIHLITLGQNQTL